MKYRLRGYGAAAAVKAQVQAQARPALARSSALVIVSRAKRQPLPLDDFFALPETPRLADVTHS